MVFLLALGQPVAKLRTERNFSACKYKKAFFDSLPASSAVNLAFISTLQTVMKFYGLVAAN